MSDEVNLLPITYYNASYVLIITLRRNELTSSFIADFRGYFKKFHLSKFHPPNPGGVFQKARN